MIISTNKLTLHFLCRRNISWRDLDHRFWKRILVEWRRQISNHENMEKNRVKNATETETHTHISFL